VCVCVCVCVFVSRFTFHFGRLGLPVDYRALGSDRSVPSKTGFLPPAPIIVICAQSFTERIYNVLTAAGASVR
jgi:hypothetical protein